MKQRTSRPALFSLIAVLALSGCASMSAKQESPLFWPDAPEDPKIAYVKQYRQETDFRERSFLDSLFGSPSGSLFSKPYGVFAEGSVMYVTDTGTTGVMAYNTTERKFRFFFGDKDRLRRPTGVAVGPDGMVLVSDAKQSRVYGFSKEGKQVMAFGAKGELNNPSGIAVNKDAGRLYVVDSREHMVFVYSLAGELLFSFGGFGIEDGQFMSPTNIALDRRNGTIYIVDTLNCRIQAFDKDGKFLRKFGELGDTPGTFTRPKGIGVDSDGHVYVSDAAFDNFQVFDEKGQLMIFIGSAGREPGRFSLPAGMHVDENDRIYVVDSANLRVQVFQYLSEKWKAAHPDEYRRLTGAAGGETAPAQDRK